MPWDGLCHDGMVTCLYSGVDKPNKDFLSLSASTTSKIWNTKISMWDDYISKSKSCL